MVLLTLFNVVIKPGAGVIASSSYPMVDGFVALFGESTRKNFILYEYPAQFFNFLAMQWCLSRQTWALSRGVFTLT